MNTIQKICKKFQEDQEPGLTSVYESQGSEVILKSEKQQEDIDIYQRETGKLGTHIEDYFYLKLKKYLKTENDFRGTYNVNLHIQKMKESVLNYVENNTAENNKNSNTLKIKGMDLIKIIKEQFETTTQRIQIDSLFPNINGNILKKLFNELKDYSYYSNDFESSIETEKKYNLIVESCHNIISQAYKKMIQLKVYFTIFNQTKKIYEENKEILKEFYLNFLKYFKIIRDSVNISNISDVELLENSNFIYIVCSNKNYLDNKKFQEIINSKEENNNIQELLSYLNKNKNVPKKVKIV